MKRVLLVLAILAIALIVPSAHSYAAGRVIHSVTGAGAAFDDPIVFRSSIAAVKQSNGQTSGETVTHLDLSAFELPDVAFHAKINCLDVDGSDAWIGGVIDYSSQPDIAPVGVWVIIHVRDLGGNGQDMMNGDFFEPGTACEERPALHPVPSAGNFNVR